MALVTITGYPCSGKSQRAAQIKAYLEARLADPAYNGPKLSVVLISDDNLNINRSAYNGTCSRCSPCRAPDGVVQDSRSEKPARATLFTTIQRNLGQSNILIIDSLNYIKGFRYQLYCVAREMKVRVCTVSVFFDSISPPCLETVLNGIRRCMYSLRQISANSGMASAKVDMNTISKREFWLSP